MNLPTRAKEVALWLDISLTRDPFCELWLFGSFTTDKEQPSDVDVLGVFEERNMQAARRQRSVARKMFQTRFGLPLHLTLLTTAEVQEVQQSVQTMLRCAWRLR